MNSPIQTIARGVLGFLQLKNFGKNPNELLSEIRPTLELTEWFFDTNSEAQQVVTGAIAANGPVVGFTVPEGEYWVVDTLTVVLNLAAAATIIAAPSYAQGNGFTLMNHLMTRQSFAQATDGTDAVMTVRPDKLFIGPGGTLGFFVFALSAATTSSLVHARITRLRV